MHCADSIAHSLSEVRLILDQCEGRSVHETGEPRTVDDLRNLNSSMGEAVDTIMACTMHQKRIIDDILSLSKLDSDLLEICPTVFQVKTFLGQVESTFKAEAEQAGVQLVGVADPSLSKLGVDWIDADLGRITQVLFNMVANAIKFTKDKSGEKAVTVRIGVAVWPPTAIFDGLVRAVQKTGPTDQSPSNDESSEEDIFLWFKVEDTGCGMDEATKARLFTQFTQNSPKTHSKYGGSGLGLSISQKLAALLGGEIGFQSEQHIGSTFAFYTKASRASPPRPPFSTRSSGKSINTAESTSQSPHAMNNTLDAPPPSRSSILLVEDNMVNQRVLKKQLQRHGYIVYTADNGQEAFDFIKTTRHWKGSTASQPCIDVILMDIEMPIVNGLECASMIRAAQEYGSIDKHLYIIAVTANARPEQLKCAKETGMDDAVPKPFRVRDLAAVIEQLRDE
jgi:CheY-like chemotaxis protein